MAAEVGALARGGRRMAAGDTASAAGIAILAATV